MNWHSDKASKQRLQKRLKAVQRQWAWEDQRRGFTVYRQTKPAWRKKANQPSMVAELAFVVGCVVVVIALLSL